jgi:signal transduction histidine kinase
MVPEDHEQHAAAGSVREDGSPGSGHASTNYPMTFRELLDLVLTSQDFESALKAVARLSLPNFGAWSIVDVIEPSGTKRRLAIIHPDPDKQEVLRTLPSGWPPETEDPIGAPVVMRTREPHVVREVTDEMLVTFARNEENLRALRELGIGSYLVMPLLVGDEILGAVTFVSDTAGYRYTEANLAEAEELAALIALVIHNARQQRDTRRARDHAQRAAEESRRQRQDLEHVMEVQARLVRGFSHDLKNPLGAARGHADLLVTGVKGDLAPDQRESVERIRSNIEASLALIEDLVSYASKGLAKLDIQPAATDIRQIGRDIAGEYRAQVEAAGLDLQLDLPEDIPLIWSDRIRIRQVLGNLLSNAVKYTAEGSVGLRAEVHHNGATPDGGEAIAIRVSDTGSGIPAEKQSLLFQEFARLDPTATAGVGLGLAISRTIAHALAGEITVESTEGEGSTFTLWLPLLPVRDEDAERPEG